MTLILIYYYLYDLDKIKLMFFDKYQITLYNTVTRPVISKKRI